MPAAYDGGTDHFGLRELNYHGSVIAQFADDSRSLGKYNASHY